MNLTKEEFHDWKTQHATKEFFTSIISRIEDAKDILAISAGTDPLDDKVYVGMIKAFREVLSVEWEEE